jgi:hypothetical protein
MAGTRIITRRCGAGTWIMVERSQERSNMAKSKATRTAWVWLCDAVDRVIFTMERDIETERGSMRTGDFRDLFGWAPGKRAVEVRLERVDRRASGTMKPNRKPRTGGGRKGK